MIIFGKSLRGLVNPNVRIILKPFIVIGVVVILAFYLVKEGYFRVSGQISEFKKTQNERNILFNKANTLKEIGNARLDPDNKTLIALPAENPVMLVMSQLKTWSSASLLTLNKLELSPGLGSELNSIIVKANFSSGDLKSIYDFLYRIPRLSPLTTLKSVVVDTERGVYTLGLELSVYWSSFPKTIPAVNEPIRVLTNEELEVIERVSQLSPPSFTSLQPNFSGTRENPFR